MASLHDRTAPFPAARPRRLRQAEWVRRLTRQSSLQTEDLIWSLIVHDGREDRQPVAAMPGVDRLSVDAAAAAAERAVALGIPAVAIFPNIAPIKKDRVGTEALNPDGLVPACVKAMKAAAPQLGVMVDVALDPFTDHGHDGILENGRILNDETVARLADQAVLLAEAGADILAPSDMMDGRVGAIRTALENARQPDALILSYAAKYASCFYGPYRDAIGTAVALQGDKKTYQMDFGNSDEALKECAMDVAEGADMLMVKPGLPYLDIIRRVKDAFGLPTFAFQVSGEYAMIKAASANGWLDENRAILETLTAFKRAGADGVVTYFAEQAALLLKS
ncbi:MAG: porphobilinogen synthase [Alphaproteobacteria bacterium]|nr:porphobilinogen synthase [Alphaproteobacteria bacterium]